MAFIVSSAIQGCVHGDDWRADLLWTTVFGGCAVLLLALVGSLGIRVLLRSRLPGEIARGNEAAGVAAAAHYAATGLVVGRCLYGDDVGTLGISVVFFAIAQATLHLFLMLFRSLTSYSDDQEIMGQNVAAALSYAGATLAIAVIVGHAAEGDFVAWGQSLRAGAQIRRLDELVLRQPFALRGGGLDRLVAQERNVGASAVEAVSYLAAAFLLTGIA